jgi:hypothetical protein
MGQNYCSLLYQGSAGLPKTNADGMRMFGDRPAERRASTTRRRARCYSAEVPLPRVGIDSSCCKVNSSSVSLGTFT